MWNNVILDQQKQLEAENQPANVEAEEVKVEQGLF